MPDTSTEVAIATTTLGSATNTITFSSIPSTYTDLRLVLVCSGAGGNLTTRFNSDSGTNYSYTEFQGYGSGSASNRSSNVNYIYNTSSGQGIGTTVHFYTMDIFSYAGSTYKTCLNTSTEDDNGSGAVVRQVALWRSTSAITTILLTDMGGNFNIGTTATLYGIL